jgi:hypothetical protein
VADEIELLRRFIDEIPGPSTDAWARARAAIAAVRSGEEPARFANGTGPRRRRMLAGAVGAGVAAAVAGLLAVLLPVSAGHGSPQITTAAYVSRIEHALSPSGQAGLVEYWRIILPPGFAAVPTANGIALLPGRGASSQWTARTVVSWTYRGTSEVSAFTAAGQRVLGEKIATTPGGGTEVTAVNYRDPTWWRAVSKAGGGSPPQRCAASLQIGPGSRPAAIRSGLKCGSITTDGRQRVDGIDAIKLTGLKGLATLWVDPATYLPVRVVCPVMGGGGPLTRTDFRWLGATPASLARLNLQIPPGFRQVRRRH